MTIATSAFVPSVSAVRAAKEAVSFAAPTLSLSASTLPMEAPVSASSFEPVLPDTTALLGMGSVVALCVVAAFVWNNQVVPISRTKLALSKRQGQVKDYLDELEESEDERPLETWLFTDWLNGRNSNERKEPALPFLKKAKWNSGDNPVVVTSALLILGVLVAACTERVFV